MSMSTRHRHRRRTLVVVLVAALAGLLPAVPAQAAASSTTTLKLSQSGIRHGEMVWITGKVTSGGKASPGRKVVVERRLGSGSWKTVGTPKTSASGTFTVRQRPTHEFSFRARVLATSTRGGDASVVRTISFTAGDRTLAGRAKVLGARVGAPTSGIGRPTVSGVRSVAYRTYGKEMLVQVRSTKNVLRTWLVYGDVLVAYKKQGGPKGSLGVPIADPKCGLLEGGCVQRFQHGSIYDNRRTKGVVAMGSGRKTEIIAAERSQVGYQQKTFNSSKYNAWVGRVGAWCSVFQSWAAVASGNPGVIPKHARWADFLADVRAHEKLGKTPKVGSLVFFDTISDGRTQATHVGLVVKVKASTIVTIEANTSTPGGHGDGRGVYQKERPRSWALYYAYPAY